MKPVDQTKFYDKEKGEHGNCQQAALASLLELDLADVPNFMLDDDGNVDTSKFWQRFFKFCRSRGYEPYERHRVHGEPTFAGYYLAYGTSPRGVEHAVVYHNGKLAHDPHPSRVGIAAVTTICILVPLDPARMRAI